MAANPLQVESLPAPEGPSTVAEYIAWGEKNPVRWYVPDIVLEDGVHVLHGLEECYKTMLMLQLHEALTCGGQFLFRNVEGGIKTGIAELEMKGRPFARRLKNFWPCNAPEIAVLPEIQRAEVLSGKHPVDRLKVIVDWCEEEGLEFVSIDSLAKLFPPGHDISRQDLASEVFSQIQKLPTALILAHDRKPPHEAKAITGPGNAEIAGSGRMSQDPDAVFQMLRSDKRVPMAEFSWGKVREGEKSDPLSLFFDKVNFRLYPINPFLHLLPSAQTELIAEAERRYGWKRRTADEHIAKLKELRLADGSSAIREEQVGHTKRLVLLGRPCPSANE
jgi:AAA domain